GAHTPTRIACRISFRNSLCWGPTPTRIACRNWESNFSLLGPLTRVEKSLLQAHFHSVNY
ncbi:hypothetical protein AJ303_00385, partial [Staphylococcus aureus]